MNRREFVKRAAAVVVASAATARGQQTSPAKSPIPRRPLGKTGVDVPVLILGGVAGMKQAPTLSFHPAQLADAALDAGINYFDTAPSYADGQSESNYGEVLATRRKEVFLASKTGSRSYDGTLRSVEASLKRLRTDHLDLLQLHGVTAKEDFAKWEGPSGVLKAMYKLRDEKVTRFVGVTGHESAEAMRRAIELFDFDTILTTFNPDGAASAIPGTGPAAGPREEDGHPGDQGHGRRLRLAGGRQSAEKRRGPNLVPRSGAAPGRGGHADPLRPGPADHRGGCRHELLCPRAGQRGHRLREAATDGRGTQSSGSPDVMAIKENNYEYETS